MNEKILTIKIFEAIETMDEYEKTCASFNFLLKHGGLKPEPLLFKASQIAFRRINNLKNYGL